MVNLHVKHLKRFLVYSDWTVHSNCRKSKHFLHFYKIVKIVYTSWVPCEKFILAIVIPASMSCSSCSCFCEVGPEMISWSYISEWQVRKNIHLSCNEGSQKFGHWLPVWQNTLHIQNIHPIIQLFVIFLSFPIVLLWGLAFLWPLGNQALIISDPVFSCKNRSILCWKF